MKRKIFSKLLMVALVIAAVGSFVSCKDYDDDINNLQKQIDAKAAIAQIESLQSQLTAAQTAAQKAQTDATKALADAAAAAKTAGDAATAKALEDAIAKVNAAAEEAAKKNADAIKAAADAAAAAGSDAAAAKTAADEAKAAAEKAAADAQKAIKDAIDALVIPTMPDLSGYATKSEVLTEAQIKALISQNAQAKGEYLTASTLSAALADLGISASSGQVDLTPINNAIAAYKTAIDQLYSMVTSVELIGTWTGGDNSGIAIGVPGVQRLNANYNIPFIHGKQATDESFGNNEDKFFQFDEADQVTYKTGDDIRTNKSLLIRVNPTNASFTKEQIQFVDSKGRDLSNFIEIIKIERYTGLVTRSTDNSGLWAVSIKVKDGADKAAFNTNVYEGGELNAINEIAGGRQICYAVAIKNDTTTTNRYVASTYDLTTRWTDYVPANYFDLDFEVTATNNGRLFNKNNRWDNTYNSNASIWEDGILGENDRDKIFDNPELTWAVPALPKALPTANDVIPAGAYLTAADGAALASANPFNDRRRWGNANFLEVDPGQSITLSNIDGYAAYYKYYERNNRYYWENSSKIEYYYVTLDLGNAIESRPSEFNAWKSYNIGGLNTMTKGEDNLVLTFDDPTLAGDYIGFRVYAVNYDGTLVDPDGRAFYVHVTGEAPVINAVNVDVTTTVDFANFTTPVTWNQNTGSKNITNNTYETLTNIRGSYNYSTTGFSGYQRFWIIADPTNYEVSYYNNGGNEVRVYWELLDSNGNRATNWKDIVSVRTAIDKPDYVLDNSELPAIYLYGTSQNASGYPTLNEMNIIVKKVMPSQAASTPEWRASLEPDATGLLTVYPWPTDASGLLGGAAHGGTTLWTSAPVTVNRIGKDLTLYVNNKNEFENWTVNKNAGVGNTAVILDGNANDDFDGDGIADDNEPSAWTLISNSSKIGQTYNTHIEYSYDNIHTYWDDNAQRYYYREDYIVNTWTSSLTSGKIKYANAMDLFTYGLNSYVVTGTTTSTDLYLKWVDVLGGAADALQDPTVEVTHFFGKSATADQYLTNVTSVLDNLLKNTTTDVNKRLATNAGIVETGNAVEIANNPGCTTSMAVSLTAPVFDSALYPGGIFASLSGQVTTLIQLTDGAGNVLTSTTPINTANALGFKRIVPGDVPTADKTGTITVTGKDVFGKSHTIATINFTLLYNK